MDEIILTVTTTGSSGSATGTATTEGLVYGVVAEVRFDFHASAPATTDTTLSEVDGATLLTLTNTATDVTLVPHLQACDAVGALIPGVYLPRVVCGRRLRISVAGCNALTAAVVAYIKVV